MAARRLNAGVPPTRRGRRTGKSRQRRPSGRRLHSQVRTRHIWCGMELAGIAVERLAVLELAERLAHAGYTDTAALLLTADASGDERVGLSVKDREAVIDVLVDTPDSLAQLHGVLVVEHMSRTLDKMA